MGDPDARFDTLSPQGSIAHDFAQSFQPDELLYANLDSSDIIAEVVFPCTFDLKDILIICRAIQEGEKTCNYTLRSFNCYFFALAIQSALARLATDWENTGPWLGCRSEAITATSRALQTGPHAHPEQSILQRILIVLYPHTKARLPSLEDTITESLRGCEMSAYLCAELTKIHWYSDLGPVIDDVLEMIIWENVALVLKRHTGVKVSQSRLCSNFVISTTSADSTFSGEEASAISNSPLDKRLHELGRALIAPLEAEARRRVSDALAHLPNRKMRYLGHASRDALYHMGSIPHVKRYLPRHNTHPTPTWVTIVLILLTVGCLWPVFCVTSIVSGIIYLLTGNVEHISVDKELALILVLLEKQSHLNLLDIEKEINRIQILLRNKNILRWDLQQWSYIKESAKEQILHKIFNSETAMFKVMFQVSCSYLCSCTKC